MTKNVILSISGLHTDVYKESENEEGIEVITPATYVKSDGQHFIFFEEISESSRKITKNRITISDSSVEIRKTGETNSTMLFEKNKRNVGLYEIYLGTLKVGVFTKEIAIEENESNIFVELKYDMDIDMEAAQTCVVKMHIRAKENMTQ